MFQTITEELQFVSLMFNFLIPSFMIYCKLIAQINCIYRGLPVSASTAHVYCSIYTYISTFAHCFMWLCNSVFRSMRTTNTQDVYEHGTKDDICI